MVFKARLVLKEILGLQEYKVIRVRMEPQVVQG